MPRRRSVEDLSFEELRQLLIEKRRHQRNQRIEVYRRTGRVIQVDTSAPPAIDAMLNAPYDSARVEDCGYKPNPWRTFFDRMLFLIEITAVVGLGYVIFNGVNLMRSLNHEVASALVQPTLTPTAIITTVVLPSGHVPPIEGVTRFNENEIPEHLRPLVQSLNAALVLPTPSPEHAQNIKIAALDLFAPVVQGDGWEQLKKGVAQHLGTPNPGQTGNMVLSAHNDVFGELFRDLNKLKPGDEIILYTQQKAYTYVVRQAQIVEPTQVEVMAPTHEPVLTLISCYPYMVDNQRIVVTADLINQ